ncbi:hypothetical protein SDC9_194009 [bioreactor metagenome]|uniref:Uncharacterized protein n=1 Tax=bioreactor metagenome TaxID=1076179 RepID=A0A645IGD6_9ZZZZ
MKVILKREKKLQHPSLQTWEKSLQLCEQVCQPFTISDWLPAREFSELLQVH